MSNAFSISASGLANSAASFSKAAGQLVRAFAGGPAPKDPGPQPASASPPGAAPVAGSPAGASAVAAQQQAEPASWMVEILRARAAYRANAEAMQAEDNVARASVDLIG